MFRFEGVLFTKGKNSFPLLDSYYGQLLLLFSELSGFFQNKMTRCESEVSDCDLFVYNLLGRPLEKPRTYSDGRQKLSLLMFIEVSELVIKVTGEVIKCLFMWEGVKTCVFWLCRDLICGSPGIWQVTH